MSMNPLTVNNTQGKLGGRKFSKQNILNVVSAALMMFVATGVIGKEESEGLSETASQLIDTGWAFAAAAIAAINVVLRTFFNQGPIFAPEDGDGSKGS